MDPRAASDLTFCAVTVWREARAEPREGQLAVAYSILTRVEHPGWWGHTLIEVVTKKWQFSSMTDPMDPQLTKWPTSYDRSWLTALEVAAAAIGRYEENPAPSADSYYAVSIRAPKWATPETFVRQVGNHRFYALGHDVEMETQPIPPRSIPCEIVKP